MHGTGGPPPQAGATTGGYSPFMKVRCAALAVLLAAPTGATGQGPARRAGPAALSRILTPTGEPLRRLRKLEPGEEAPEAPASPTYAQCRAAIPPAAEYAFLRAALPEAEPRTGRRYRATLEALTSGCEELPQLGAAGQVLERRPESFELLDGFVGAGGSALATMGRLAGAAEGHDWPQWFRESLDGLASITDPAERVRAVFELVARGQGDYDHRQGTFVGGVVRPVPYTPGDTLRRATTGDPSGVCRDYATLLFASLRRVRRVPGDGRSYQVALVTAAVPDPSRAGSLSLHMWVRVALPRGRSWEFIDLDSTWYQGWAPLPVRFSEPDTETVHALRLACGRAYSCVSGAYGRRAP